MKTSRHDAPHWRREVQIVDEMYDRGTFAMPVHYVLSLTHACNLKCPFCFLEKTPGHLAMRTEDWLAVLDQLPPYARVILFGGEPLLFPGFAEVFRAAASRFDVSIVTNGTLLTADTVEMLVAHEKFCDLNVSVDSLGNTNRNVDTATWQRLVDGVHHFNRLRRERPRPPKLGISVVLLDETAEQLHDLHRFAHETLGCDFVNYCLLNGAPMQLADVMRPLDAVHTPATAPHYEKWDLILAQLERNRQYDRDHGHVAYLRPKLIDVNESSPTEALRGLNQPGFTPERYGPCKQPWSDCRIHPDGNVSACLSVSFGNVKQTGDLATILDGPAAHQFRDELRRRKFFAQCERCVFLYDRAFDRTAAPGAARASHGGGAMNRLVVFGAGQIARTVAHYAEAWGVGEVCAFAVDAEFITQPTCDGRPVVAAANLRDLYPPDSCRAFVAVGYQELNGLRARVVERLRGWGYDLASVVNPTARPLVTTGANCLVIPGESLLEPFVTLGDDVFVWNAVSLSHFVSLADHCWLSNGTVLGGNVAVGRSSFLGLGVTVTNRVRIGAGCLVGSGALVTRDLDDGQAVLPRATAATVADARVAQALLR